ncbi:MAG: sulfatase-like hydrolase/transferase, partial [Thermoguttaceae bacterium]
MTRMQKLLLLGWAACCVLVVTRAAAENTPQRPNVLLILTDQQHAGMMSCTGNPNLKTPAMDALASRGVRFEKAYCANPVC